MTEKDTLFASGASESGTFQFDERVVEVFPDMISRSVPGYGLVVPMTGLLARQYARDDSNVYDLGCSLGAATLAMREAIRASGVRIIAVDNSAAMVERCRQLAGQGGRTSVEVLLADIRDVEIENASFVAMNFTLQFIEPSAREILLRGVANGMLPGGALVLSEKIVFKEPAEQELQTAWYHDYKRAKGYSELEIAAKRTALENVLIPNTEAEHLDRLRRAGFSRVTRWFQCFNFCSYIAFK